MKQALSISLLILASLGCSVSFANPVTATPYVITQTPLPPTQSEPVIVVVTATQDPTPLPPEPTNTLVIPTNAPETLYTNTPNWRDDECLNAPVPMLRRGKYALVTTTDGDKLRMRAEPHRSAQIIYAVEPGRMVFVAGGYDCNDGWIWWPIKVDGYEGWASEGTTENGIDQYWLTPVP